MYQFARLSLDVTYHAKLLFDTYFCHIMQRWITPQISLFSATLSHFCHKGDTKYQPQIKTHLKRKFQIPKLQAKK